MANYRTRLDTQTVMFDEVAWLTLAHTAPPRPSPTSPTAVTGRPTGLRAGLQADQARPPYWEFTYQLNTTSGITLTNVVVRDTQSAGSTEEVFDRVEFTDFLVTFTDGTSEPFDLTRAFSNAASSFVMRLSGGTRLYPVDTLFQRGMKLTLVDNVLAARGGVCNVTLELSAVFRGAMNDFDPGGVPVALGFWPEMSYSWSSDGATKRVRKFRGSVKLTVRNKMYPHHRTTPPAANVASFLADSNTSLMDSNRPHGTYSGIRSFFASLGGAPFGWSMVFDYVRLNLTAEREIVAVYGPTDGAFYRTATTSGARDRTYIWPSGQLLGPWDQVHVRKAERQAQYDNIHLHARMAANDARGNVQVHAPFCGHSCIHTHWRWSSISSNGAPEGAGWRYRGWSNPSGGTPQAYSLENAPQVPPNQRIVVAICRNGATRHSDAHIVNPASPAPLDPLLKLFWYWAEVHDPAAGQRQVIFSNGTGWAYRYATPDESSAVAGIAHAISNSLPWTGTPTQMQLMDFFMNDVYPTFRYMGGVLYPDENQVPQGDYDEDVTQRYLFGSLPRISMENL